MNKQFSMLSRGVIIIGLGWLIMAKILGIWPFADSKQGWRTTTHESYNFSVDYPPQWHALQYGESGYRGEHDIRILITRSIFADFGIVIRNKMVETPSLEDAVTWGDERIVYIIESYVDGGNQSDFQEIDFGEAIIDGHKVMRRRYTLGEFMIEDVYIARTNDIVIISLESKAQDFEYHLEEFEIVVRSFAPWDG